MRDFAKMLGAGAVGALVAFVAGGHVAPASAKPDSDKICTELLSALESVRATTSRDSFFVYANEAIVSVAKSPSDRPGNRPKIEKMAGAIEDLAKVQALRALHGLCAGKITARPTSL